MVLGALGRKIQNLEQTEAPQLRMVAAVSPASGDLEEPRFVFFLSCFCLFCVAFGCFALFLGQLLLNSPSFQFFFLCERRPT